MYDEKHIIYQVLVFKNNNFRMLWHLALLLIFTLCNRYQLYYNPLMSQITSRYKEQLKNKNCIFVSVRRWPVHGRQW